MATGSQKVKTPSGWNSTQGAWVKTASNTWKDVDQIYIKTPSGWNNASGQQPTQQPIALQQIPEQRQPVFEDFEAIRGQDYDRLVQERGREAANRALGTMTTTGGGGFFGKARETATSPAPTSAQEQFETARGERIVRTGEQAEAIARGEIPEGTIPTAELAKVPTGPEFEAETIQLAQRKGVTPAFVREVGP